MYADDDLDDRDWVCEACRSVNPSLRLRFAENGRQVMEFMNSLPEPQFPSLIVLDLNMPEMDGRQTLQQLKAHPGYRRIPVAIVTTSSNVIDQAVCERLGASLYLIKPDTHLEWQNIVRQLEPLMS